MVVLAASLLLPGTLASTAEGATSAHRLRPGHTTGARQQAVAHGSERRVTQQHRRGAGLARARRGRSSGGSPRLADPAADLRPGAADMTPISVGLPAANGPRSACLAAVRRAEQVHDLPQGLLVAIALAESGLHAYALNIGGRAHFAPDAATARQLWTGASARASIMAGCVQVNARVHARSSDWPLDPRQSADWAGALLRRFYVDRGNWADALRRWHGGSVTSTHRVICRVRAKLEVTAPGSTLLDGETCRESETARVRRSGQALLELAESPAN